MTGRVLSKETKERISKNTYNRGGYKIFYPYINKEISVQGTWELKYATMLNKKYKMDKKQKG